MAELELTFENALEVSGLELRSAYTPLQAGAIGSGDLKVTTAGAGLVVNVAAGVGLIAGSSVPDQGLYRVRNDAAKGSAAFNAGGIAAAGGQPRLDQIIARAYDHDADGLGQRKWQLEVVTGVATAGATLDNRAGAAALPANSLRLGDVLIPAGSVGPIAAGNIRDRRLWALGAFREQSRTAGSLSTTSTSLVEGDATNLKMRLELSGAPVRVSMFTQGWNATAGQSSMIALGYDGAVAGGSRRLTTSAAGFAVNDLGLVHVIPAPTPGSHLFACLIAASGGTANFAATGGTDSQFEFIVEELIRSNGVNT